MSDDSTRQDGKGRSTQISRRGILRTTTAAAGLGLASGHATATRPAAEDEDFEGREWGYKRTDLAWPDREHPTIMTYVGYGGASEDGGPNAYLEMPDGVLIALDISYGAGPRDDYAEVTASIRGTECSGGSFNLYDRRHAWDGYEIIEWIADRQWSNGKVGMMGCSFYGQTPFFTATTQPPSLETIMVGGLHSDIYKDIVYPGGVQNDLFPQLWYVEGPNRIPTSAIDEGAIPEDRICSQNQAGRYSSDRPPLPTEYETNFLDPTYGDWWAAHAARTHAHKIDVPYYQWVNWQDEQVGPRAAVLWHWIDPPERTIQVPKHSGRKKRSHRKGRGAGNRRNNNGATTTETVVPKKLVTTTGSHCMGGYVQRDKWAWMDMWLLDQSDREGLFEHRVENYFESRGWNAEYTTATYADEWPADDTNWRRAYFHEGGRIDFTEPTGAEPTDTYVSGVPRENWFFYAPRAGKEARQADGLPDSIAFETDPFEETVTMAGPILLEFYASLAGADTDFFVSINDVFPDGNISYLQRGMLRASMRAVNEDRSYTTDDGLLYQPWYPFTNPTKVTPDEVTRYLIEIFPHSHVFRPGHKLRLQLMTPPAVDGLWGYTAKHEPAAVTVHHDAEHPTNLLLPFVEPDEPVGEAPEGCGIPGGFPCDEPPANPASRAGTGLDAAEYGEADIQPR
jgi:putative CocE/NonD family hydrolase